MRAKTAARTGSWRATILNSRDDSRQLHRASNMKTSSILMRTGMALIISAASSASAQVLSWSAVSAGGSGDPTALLLDRKAMAVDDDGNVFVTGHYYSEHSINYLTVKFAPDGHALWSARHDSPNNNNDYATALALTGDGDVVVTGLSRNDVSQVTGYTTVKYSGSNGAQLWTSPYDGSDHFGAIQAVAVTSSGDIVVTGTSQGSNGKDFLTVRHSGATGAQQWVSRYNGAANGDDYAKSIALTSSGDVVVTGSSPGSGSSVDYATVRYNGTTGIEQWVSRYNSVTNGFDDANQIAITGSDDVIVTGQSSDAGSSIGTATVKYAGNTGIEQWVNRNNIGGTRIDVITGLATTSTGDVVVTGHSRGSAGNIDYMTVKYAGATGAEQWAMGYDSPEHGEDYARALALDQMDNVLVTGQSSSDSTSIDYVTLKYSGATGAELWNHARIYNGPLDGDDWAYAIAVDGAGDVVVAGRSTGNEISTEHPSYDYRVVKYSGANGDEQWSSKEPNIEGLREEMACSNALLAKDAAAVDAAGNTYVTGCASRSSTFDFLTVKFDPDGNVLWSVTYGAPDGGTQEAYALAIADNGDVVVTGMSIYGNGTSDYVTVKYDGASGNVLWASRYNGAQNDNDYAVSVAITSTGDVVVTGTSKENDTFSVYTTLKYAGGDGTELWKRSYDRLGISAEFATKVVVDSVDNVVVTGYASISSSDNDYVTVKYSGADGTQLWERVYNGPANGDDEPVDVAITSTDDVVVTGYSRGIDSGPDYATLKYAGNTGADVWASRYNGPDNAEDTAIALVVTDINDVVVTGRSLNSDGSDEYATVKYSSADGAELWSARHDASAEVDYPTSLAVTADDGIVVTGASGGDYAVLKFAGADGNSLWQLHHDFGVNAVDEANLVLVAQDGSLRIAGNAITIGGRRIGVLRIDAPIFRDGFETPAATFTTPVASEAIASARGP